MAIIGLRQRIQLAAILIYFGIRLRGKANWRGAWRLIRGEKFNGS